MEEPKDSSQNGQGCSSKTLSQITVLLQEVIEYRLNEKQQIFRMVIYARILKEFRDESAEPLISVRPLAYNCFGTWGLEDSKCNIYF